MDCRVAMHQRGDCKAALHNAQRDNSSACLQRAVGQEAALVRGFTLGIQPLN